MIEVSPTRSALVEMKDERRAMHEGHRFLDEKCLLLAGEILRELARYGNLQREWLRLHELALAALQAAVARHGLQGLQVHPAPALASARLQTHSRSLMGVNLQEAKWLPGDATSARPVQDSPEAQDCRRAFAALLDAAAPLAAVAGNLERLSLEYRRSLRRARALQDVMLPELERSIGEVEGRLEELEQEDAIWMRQGSVRRRA